MTDQMVKLVPLKNEILLTPVRVCAFRQMITAEPSGDKNTLIQTVLKEHFISEKTCLRTPRAQVRLICLIPSSRQNAQHALYL